MAQYRPFAIWDGVSSIPSGTSQSQNILIGVADQNYKNLGGLDWWAGPDESLGYVIAYHDNTFTHPNQLNIPCGIGFLRSSALTDISFLELFNHLMEHLGQPAILNVNDAKTWLLANGYWTSYGEAAWSYSSPSQPTPNPPSVNGGEWFFYSTQGQLDVGPPTSPGNFIIVESDPNTGTLETYDPNFDGSTQKTINLNISDSSNNSFSTEFNNLAQNGGTINLTQNGQTATYYSATPGPFFINTIGGSSFFAIQAGIQTTSTEGPFTYGDPIEVSFGPGGSNSTGTKIYWNAGNPTTTPGDFAASMQNQNNLAMATNFYINENGLNSAGTISTNHAAFLAALASGTGLVVKSTLYPNNTATYTITAATQLTPNSFNISVSYVSGSGMISGGLWEFEFI